MSVINDWRRVRRLGRYLVHDRRRLLLTLVLLVLSVLRDDWMIGLVAVINLITGDAGLVLLAKIGGTEQ